MQTEPIPKIAATAQIATVLISDVAGDVTASVFSVRKTISIRLSFLTITELQLLFSKSPLKDITGLLFRESKIYFFVKMKEKLSLNIQETVFLPTV